MIKLLNKIWGHEKKEPKASNREIISAVLAIGLVANAFVHESFRELFYIVCTSYFSAYLNKRL